MASARASAARRAQDNLQNTLAAHRAHLQPSAGSGGPPPLLPSGGTLRPPQLPNVNDTSDTVSLGIASASEVGVRKNASQQPQSPRGPASRVRSCIKDARSFSVEAFERSLDSVVDGSVDLEGMTSKPNSASSSRATPRSSSTRSSRGHRKRTNQRERDANVRSPEIEDELPGWRHRTEAEEEEDFDADMVALEELCLHLNLRTEERQGLVEIEPRPLTGGTSASASTTVPGGSTGFEMASSDFEELNGGDIRPNSDNPLEGLLGGERASYELLHGRALPHGCRVEQTPGVASQYIFSVDASEGPYAPATISFWIKIFAEFPARDGVSIRCAKKVFHPNIDQDTGLVKLQQDLMEAEVRFIDILLAVRQLVLNPTDSPAANQDAAMLLQTNPEEFRRVVRTTLGGGEYRGVHFDRSLEFKKKTASSGYPSEQNQVPKMSDQAKLGLMNIEVMQAQFKAFANEAMKQNIEACQNLSH